MQPEAGRSAHKGRPGGSVPPDQPSGLHPYSRSGRPESTGGSAAIRAGDAWAYWSPLPFGPSSPVARRVVCPLLTSARRSDGLTTASVPPGTPSRSPEVSSPAVRAHPPDLRFAPLMDMDFAHLRSLVRRARLRSGFCTSGRAFAIASFRPRLAATPLRVATPSPPSGWGEDFHLRAGEHARHT